MIMYPGRKLVSNIEIRTKQTLTPLAEVVAHSLEFVDVFSVELPYEGTGANDRCPCDSGLRFKKCCATPHDFDSVFIDEFERRHFLGKYDNGEYSKI